MNATVDRSARRALSLVAEQPSLVNGPRGDVTSLDTRQRALRAGFRVALVSMPFQSAAYPSIQLGLLRAIGESHGFPVETFHLSIELARRMDLAMYERLCEMRGRLAGDWLFSVAAFREEAPDDTGRFIHDFQSDVAAQFADTVEGKATATDLLRSRLTALRIRDEIVPAFLNAMMAQVDWSQFAVVGFSSVFQQTVPSLALARRIKERYPQVQTVFGGSNFEDEMGLELVRKVPWIDHAVIGEGDVSFPELLVALSEGVQRPGIKGIASRVDGEVSYPGPRRLLEDLDALPTPRYDEYFARAEAAGFVKPSKRRTTHIPYESSRGCWWGQKHHCTFCGLNAGGMRFRSKSPERVSQEIAELARTNRTFWLDAVDNIIDTDYLTSLLPRLAEQEAGYQLFYETKSNLTREQIRALWAAGVTGIQPGIESLSTHVLRLMRKGVTAIHNVNTLRWCTYYGITVAWNLLYGFPGESAEDYAEQARLFPRLRHLRPPGSAGRIWMERFSPIYTDTASFPTEYRRAEASYAYVYPSSIDVDKIAYFFEYKLKNTLSADAYLDFRGEVSAWSESWKPALSGDGGAGPIRASGAGPASGRRPSLTFRVADDFMQIADSRGSESASFTFEGPLAALYKVAVDRPVTAQRALELASLDADVSDATRALHQFCEQGIMMRDDERFLALALPAVPGR